MFQRSFNAANSAILPLRPTTTASEFFLLLEMKCSTLGFFVGQGEILILLTDTMFHDAGSHEPSKKLLSTLLPKKGIYI